MNVNSCKRAETHNKSQESNTVNFTCHGDNIEDYIKDK